MKEFLDESMAKIYSLSSSELEQIKMEFEHSLFIAEKFFNGTPFRIKSAGEKNIFNTPLFDSLLVTLSNLSVKHRNLLLERRKSVKYLLLELIQEKEFIDIISSKNASTKEGVIKRFKVAELLFNSVLKDGKRN